MEKVESGTGDKYPKPDKIFGVRHVQVVLLFLLLTIGYAMRVNLSVGINAMTDPNATANPDVPTYDWTNKSIILSSFYWGYIVLQIFAGQLSKSYGPKWFISGAMLINCLACLATPLMAAEVGSEGVMACRIIQGLSQGFFYPSVHALLGKWTPTPERSRFGTFVYCGSSFGTAISMPITGFICASWIGWPSSFYIFGALGIMWIILWTFIGANSPSENKYISEEEKNYIIHSFGPETDHESENSTPWKSILTSLPVWAIIVGNFGQNWGYATLLTEIPSYLSGVMHFDMAQNGVLSAAPYLAFLVLSFVFGPISDSIINKQILSRGAVRKIFNTIGVGVPAVSLIILGFVPDEQVALSIVLLVIAVGSNAAVFCGFQVNHIDLSPNHAGVLMGMSNGPANIFSIIGPLVVQAVVGNDTGDKLKWRIIFIISAVVYIISDIFYILFATGEIQPWNNCKETERQERQNSQKNDRDRKKSKTQKVH